MLCIYYRLWHVYGLLFGLMDMDLFVLIFIVSISDEDSLSEITLSDASKLASTFFTLFYKSVHVLYTGICILGGCLC